MKNETVRRKLENPEFPKWKNPSTGAGFLFGGLLWILMAIIFLVILYIQLFSYNLKYLLNLILPGNYQIPFWFSLIMTIVLFPVTLAVILAGGFIRIISSR